MTFSQVAVEFPRLAAELGKRSGDELEVAVRRIVEGALTATGLEVTDRSAAGVERLVWSLDDATWKLREEADRGEASGVLYQRAFLKSRAASGLLEFVEGRYGSAVYEATQALNANQDTVIGLFA